jgi:hypothetical protein
MVEMTVRDAPSSFRSSEDDALARAEALAAEARSGLARAGNSPPSMDRAAARALVEAGYMHVSDYLCLYGAEVVEPEQPDAPLPLSITARLTVAAPRRNVYRATNVRYALPKPPGRMFQWRHRA